MPPVKIVKIVTLDIQRRHLKTCSSFKEKLPECPSASKKKCPYRLFGIGLDEFGNRHRIRDTLRTNDLEDASSKLADYRANIDKLNGVGAVAKPKPSVEETMKQYFTDELLRGVSLVTLKSFHKFLDRVRDAKRFSPTLIMYTKANGIKTLNQLTSEHIKEWRGQWVLGYKTKTKQWERAKQFFQYAEDAGWIDVNPTAKIKGFNREKDAVDDLPVTALTGEEVTVILAACGKNEFMRTFMRVLWRSGLAIEGAIQLKPEKLTGNFLKTYRTKTGAQVGVELPPKLVERLNALPVLEGGYWFWNRKKDGSNHQTATGNMRRRLRPIYRKSGVLIKGKDGQPIPMKDKKAPFLVKVIDNVEVRTRPVKRDAKGKVVYEIAHSHQWRHTFVKDLIDVGTSLEDIADLIGDTYKVVATTYAHFMPERQEKLNVQTRKIWNEDD